VPVNLWQCFEDVAGRQADTPALVFADEVVTFAALRAEVERCAAWLSALGIDRESVVAISLGKQPAAFVLWLACLRQGVIYVFVDPNNPEERRERIFGTVKPALLLAACSTPNSFGRSVTLAIGDTAPWSQPAAAVAPAATHGLSPAYIMFTSGSTGEPKGAVIPHQGVMSLMRWGRTVVPQPSQERFSNLNPLHFDNSVFDLYCGLLNGAALVPVDTNAAHNPMAWVRRLRDGHATVLFAVPTLFLTLARLRLLSPASLPDARAFLFGGEGFPTDALRAFHTDFRGHARLINVYGPTETSCICSSLPIDDDALAAAGSGLASLGRMHADFDWAVLDAEGRRVDAGDTGELWIGGSNVGLGYFGNDTETARRFCQDPRQSAFRSTWYRSGDLVKADADGLLWFQGRADNQVKVRGHRIELEEIDLAIESFSGVQRAVAVLVNGADGPAIKAAFVASSELSGDELREHCGRVLPEYMRPSTIVQLDTLPQNANGKTDRRATAALLSRAD
jgi:D-alanine--poly(phosphoribitol) ligase subunit 1